MTITIERESEIPLPFNEQEVAEAVISETLDYEECPYEVQVNIILTSNEEIQQINLEQRGIDAPTDVLSFPMIEYAYPSDFTVLETDGFESFDPDTGELILGDIVIVMIFLSFRILHMPVQSSVPADVLQRPCWKACKKQCRLPLIIL